jgi:hypothetical protein
MKERNHVVGIFETRQQAERGVHDLRRAGFKEDQIAMVMHHDTAAEITDMDAAKAAQVSGQSKATEGAVAGAATGALVGGLLALVPAWIPGFGPVLTIGTLAGALFGVAAGGASGGILGGLIGADFPEEEARVYERELKAGHVLVGVKAGNRFQEAYDILHLAGAYDATAEPAMVSGPAEVRTDEPVPGDRV